MKLREGAGVEVLRLHPFARPQERRARRRPDWALCFGKDARLGWVSVYGSTRYRRFLIGDAKRKGDSSYCVYTLVLDGTGIRPINDKSGEIEF